MRSQARDGREQRQVQQLSASSGGDRRGADRLERHRQGVAAGADEVGDSRKPDTERRRETAAGRDDNQYAGLVYDVAVGQR